MFGADFSMSHFVSSLCCGPVVHCEWRLELQRMSCADVLRACVFFVCASWGRPKRDQINGRCVFGISWFDLYARGMRAVWILLWFYGKILDLCAFDNLMTCVICLLRHQAFGELSCQLHAWVSCFLRIEQFRDIALSSAVQQILA